MKPKISVGGHALPNGVRMLSDHYAATAVRLPDGSINVEVEPTVRRAKALPVLSWPFVRGPVLLIEMAVLICKSALSKKEIDSSLDEATQARMRRFAIYRAITLIACFYSVVGSVCWLADWVVSQFTDNQYFKFEAEFSAQVIVQVIAIWLGALHPGIKRLLQYHGAEHQAVHAVDQGRPIVAEEACRFPTAHRRCGTNLVALFLIGMVLVLPFVAPFGAALIPLVELLWFSVCFELLLLAADKRWGRWASPVLVPGMWLQRVTALRPDMQQLELACAAARAVIEAEQVDEHRLETVNIPSRS